MAIGDILMSDVFDDRGWLTRVSPRRYSLIQYNPVASTCTSVTLANGVLTDLECCTYIHALKYLRYTTYTTLHLTQVWVLILVIKSLDNGIQSTHQPQYLTKYH